MEWWTGRGTMLWENSISARVGAIWTCLGVGTFNTWLCAGVNQVMGRALLPDRVVMGGGDGERLVGAGTGASPASAMVRRRGRRAGRKSIEVHYCPTDKMVANCNSKLLQGKPFNFMRRMLLGHDIIQVPFTAKDCARQECVGQSDHSIQSQSHIEPHSRERSSIGDIDI